MNDAWKNSLLHKVKIWQAIAMHGTDEMIEDMCERKNYHSHMFALEKIAESAADFQFEIRSAGQRGRWRKVNQIQRRV